MQDKLLIRPTSGCSRCLELLLQALIPLHTSTKFLESVELRTSKTMVLPRKKPELKQLLRRKPEDRLRLRRRQRGRSAMRKRRGVNSKLRKRRDSV